MRHAIFLPRVIFSRLRKTCPSLHCGVVTRRVLLVLFTVTNLGVPLVSVGPHRLGVTPSCRCCSGGASAPCRCSHRPSPAIPSRSCCAGKEIVRACCSAKSDSCSTKKAVEPTSPSATVVSRDCSCGSPDGPPMLLCRHPQILTHGVELTSLELNSGLCASANAMPCGTRHRPVVPPPERQSV